MLKYPEDLKYTESFEWVKEDGNLFLVGISDFAQDQLGDIVYVDLPEVGSTIESGEILGELESSKAVSEINMPFKAEVIEVNGDLEDSPELINNDPYGTWIVKIKASNRNDFDRLLDNISFRKLAEAK